MEEQIRSFVASYHFRKNLGGSNTPNFPGIISTLPWQLMVFELMVFGLIVVIQFGFTVMFIVMAAILALYILQMAWDFLVNTPRMKRTMEYLQSEEKRRETQEKINRQAQELIDILPNLSPREHNLLWTIVMFGKETPATRFLPRLVSVALGELCLSQTELIREMASDLKVKTNK